jgi:hypothetical protein
MTDSVLREHILKLLSGGNAHMDFDAAVADFPLDLINIRPPNVNYTCWHLVEHLRLAQWDILDFIRNPDYVWPEWPAGYWPAQDAESDPAGWAASIEAFRADLEALREIVRDPEIELAAELPHAPGYTYLREMLVVADHNAYHVGELAILRQIMTAWPADRV